MFQDFGTDRGKNDSLFKQANHMAHPLLWEVPYLMHSKAKAHWLFTPLAPKLLQALYNGVNLVLRQFPGPLILDEFLSRLDLQPTFGLCVSELLNQFGSPSGSVLGCVNELLEYGCVSGVRRQEDLLGVVRNSTDIAGTHLFCSIKQVGINVCILEHDAAVLLEGCLHPSELGRVNWVAADCRG